MLINLDIVSLKEVLKFVVILVRVGGDQSTEDRYVML